MKQAFLRGVGGLALLLVLSHPAAATPRGSFSGVFSGSIAGDDRGYTGTMTLPGGGLFPQVSLAEERAVGSDVGPEVAVSVTTGVTMPFTLALTDSLAGTTSGGRARMTVYHRNEGGTIVCYLFGTFDLDRLDADGLPYLVHGVLVGDQHTLYLCAVDGAGTAEEGDDRALFLSVAGGSPVVDDGAGGSRIADVVLGVVSGTRGERTGDRLMMDVDEANFPHPLERPVVGLPPGEAVINQVTPPDGSADLTIPGDTAEVMFRRERFTGSVPTGLPAASRNPPPPDLPVWFTLHSLGLTGGASDGLGTFAGRIEGVMGYLFVVADIGPPDSYGLPADGYLFGRVRGGRFLLGQCSGAFSPDRSTFDFQTDADWWECDPPPPEPLAADADLVTGRFNRLETLVRRVDGGPKELQLLVNGSTARNRILVRFRNNRLHLFDRAAGRWVGGCQSGRVGAIRTRWAALSCGETMSYSHGEYVRSVWSLKPSARMIGAWKVYVKMTDGSGQTTGWHLVGRTTISAP